MNQRGGLQRMSQALAPEMGGSTSPQLLIHHCQQLVPRLNVPASPRNQQTADVCIRILLGVHMYVCLTLIVVHRQGPRASFQRDVASLGKKEYPSHQPEQSSTEGAL